MKSFIVRFAGGALVGGPIAYLFIQGQPMRASLLIVGILLIIVGCALDE